MNGNKVLLGTNGAVWVNGEKLANCKSFEAKVSADFEDIAMAGSYGTDAKFKGYTIEGTMTLHKTDSKIAKLVSEGMTTGKMPEIVIVSGIDDPDADGIEKIELDGVYLTELTLSKWEVGAVGEEEVPFRAKSYKYLEQI